MYLPCTSGGNWQGIPILSRIGIYAEHCDIPVTPCSWHASGTNTELYIIHITNSWFSVVTNLYSLFG